MSTAALEKLVARLEAVAAKLEGSGGAAAGGAAGGATAAESGAAMVEEYDELVAEFIKPYVEKSKTIGDLVAQQAELVEKAVAENRKIVNIASQSKEPAQDVLQKLIGACSALMAQVSDIRDRNRGSDLFNHLSTLSEGIGALGWVVVTPKPGPFVNEARSSSEFYSNRVLTKYKGKEQLHVDWVSSWNGFLKGLAAYIKKFHTTKLAWNAKGGDAAQFAGSAGAAAPAASSAPAKPKPKVGGAPSAGAKAGLFAALNKGGDVTKGLNKVTKDMKTKNRPKEERSSVVPAKKAATPARKYGGNTNANKPAKFELEGNKWVVEYQKDGAQIVIEETEPRQTVYIYGCTQCTVQIKGKINNITVDNCKKTGVVFPTAISGFEIVNSQSCEVQCTGRCPNFAIDKCAGFQAYLNKDCLEAEFVQSKSSEMNIMVPGASEEDDMVELSVPEQFKTVIKGNKLVTEEVVHA